MSEELTQNLEPEDAWPEELTDEDWLELDSGALDSADGVVVLESPETRPKAKEFEPKSMVVEGTDDESSMRRLLTHPRLTAAEELSLAERIERGDLAAKDKLVNCNLRLVAHIARRYQRDSHDLDFNDLFQSGVLGLIRAAEKFDYRRGFKFSTYATLWIRQTIIMQIHNEGHTIRIPVNAAQDVNKIRRAENKLMGQDRDDKDITDEELSEVSGVALQGVQRLRALDRSVVTLDASLSSDSDMSLLNIVQDDQPSVEEEVLERIDNGKVSLVLDLLSERERKAVIIRCQLDEFGYTEGLLAETGMTRSELNRSFKKGIEKIRDFLSEDLSLSQRNSKSLRGKT